MYCDTEIYPKQKYHNEEGDIPRYILIRRKKTEVNNNIVHGTAQHKKNVILVICKTK